MQEGDSILPTVHLQNADVLLFSTYCRLKGSIEIKQCSQNSSLGIRVPEVLIIGNKGHHCNLFYIRADVKVSQKSITSNLENSMADFTESQTVSSN